MRYQISKKITSIVIIVAMIISISAISLADENIDQQYNRVQINKETIEGKIVNRDRYISSNEYHRIQNELSILNRFGIIDSNANEISEIQKDIDIPIRDNINEDYVPYATYTIDYGEYINNITILNDSQEEKSLYITQGDIINILTYTSEGKYYINGKEVTFSLEENNEENTIVANYMTQYYQSNPPIGIEGDYLEYVKFTSCQDVAFSNTFESLAFSTFLTIAVAAMSGGLALSVGAGCLSAVYSYLQSADPKSSHASFKCWWYHHKDGLYISAGKSVYRQFYIWYSKTGFLGAQKGESLYLISELITG